MVTVLHVCLLNVPIGIYYPRDALQSDAKLSIYCNLAKFSSSNHKS